MLKLRLIWAALEIFVNYIFVLVMRCDAIATALVAKNSVQSTNVAGTRAGPHRACLRTPLQFPISGTSHQNFHT